MGRIRSKDDEAVTPYEARVLRALRQWCEESGEPGGTVFAVAHCVYADLSVHVSAKMRAVHLALGRSQRDGYVVSSRTDDRVLWEVTRL